MKTILFIIFVLVGYSTMSQPTTSTQKQDTILTKVGFPSDNEKIFNDLDKEITDLQKELKAKIDEKEKFFKFLCNSVFVDPKNIVKVEYKPGELTLKTLKPK